MPISIFSLFITCLPNSTTPSRFGVVFAQWRVVTTRTNCFLHVTSFHKTQLHKYICMTQDVPTLMIVSICFNRMNSVSSQHFIEIHLPPSRPSSSPASPLKNVILHCPRGPFPEESGNGVLQITGFVWLVINTGPWRHISAILSYRLHSQRCDAISPLKCPLFHPPGSRDAPLPPATAAAAASSCVCAVFRVPSCKDVAAESSLF